MSCWRVSITVFRSSRLFEYPCTYLNVPVRQALLWMEMTSGAEKTVGRAEDFSKVSVDDSAYNRQYRVKVYLCVNYLLRSRLQVWSPTWEKTAGSLQVCEKYPSASVSVPVCNCASAFWLLTLKRPFAQQQRCPSPTDISSVDFSNSVLKSNRCTGIPYHCIIIRLYTI